MKIDKIKGFIKNCRYYQSISKYSSFDSLVDIPVIDRDELVKNIEQFIVDHDCRNKIIKETSGSTGKIIRVIWNANDYYASLKPIWKIRKQFGIKPCDNYITDHSWIANISINSNVKIFIDENRISLSKIYVDETTLKSYCSIIQKYSPTWMMISPSFAVMLGNFCKNENIIFDSIKLIELSGEYVSDECHEYIENLFPSVSVRSQYGLTECNVVAYEVGSSNVLEACSGNMVEILDDNGNPCGIGETGNIVVTNLPNSNMPMLRYRTGDLATVYDNSSEKLKFKIVSSRETDYYVFEDKKFHSSVFYCIIQKYNSEYPKALIDQFLFVDEGNNKLSVYVHVNAMLEDGWSRVIEEQMTATFDSIIGIRPNISVKIVREIPSISKKKNYFTINKNK